MPEPNAIAVTDPVAIAALETERFVAGAGWDQPVRLFALVSTAELVAAQPTLASSTSLSDSAPGALSAVEQDDIPEHDGIEDLLARLAWPPAVVGVLIALERIVLPPEVEAALPEDPAAALQALAAHPDRADVRLVAAATRDGRETCLLRQRANDRDDRVAMDRGIAPGLLAALKATLD